MTARSRDIESGRKPASLQSRLEGPASGHCDPRHCDPGHCDPGPGPDPGPRPDAGPVAGPDVAEPEPGVTDPVGLFRRLEASGRFHRDSGVGRMFHPGSVSLRENQATDSLHVVIHHNRVAAHVDRVSPMHLRPERSPGYSLHRAVAHNLAGMAQDLGRLLRGRQGDHRSELACCWVPDTPEAGAGPAPDDLLDPLLSAWSLHLEARASGTLDGMRLRRALAEVLGAGPAPAPGGGDVMQVLQILDCPDDEALDRARSELQAAPARISEWPPVRALLARNPDGDVLMLNVNHAASDGFGALRVLRSVAQAYRGQADRDPLPIFLTARDLPVHPAAAPVSRGTAWSRAVLENLRDLLARPAQLAPDEAGDDARYGFHMVCLSAEDTGRIVDASRAGRSRNVLLAGLHLAIGEWNLQHGAPGRRIGVLVQVNLRPPEWRDETIGNFSVTARVSTSRRHRADHATALEAITSQTTRNKRTRSGIALVAGLDRSGLLPLWAKQSRIVLQPLTSNRLIDTAMLSNLGVLDEAPSFGADAGETVNVWFSAPSRAPRSLCIGAVTVSGRLHLVFRYPRRVLGRDAARRFAGCYVGQLLLVAGSLPSVS